MGSLGHFEHVAEHLRVNIQAELDRVLADVADESIKRSVRDLVMQRFWNGTAEIIKANVSINGQSFETAVVPQDAGVEPYDEKLNRDVFAFQDHIADSVVTNTSERKAFPRRRLDDVQTSLEAYRMQHPEPPPLPAPEVEGALPDRDRTCRDFRDALHSAQRAQEALPSQLERLQDVRRIEAARARVQARTQ